MKPIHDNLKAVRIEDDETGDLLPLLDYAGQKFSNLVIALKQISELSETKLSVAVFGPGPANGPESSSSLFQPQSTAFVSSQGS